MIVKALRILALVGGVTAAAGADALPLPAPEAPGLVAEPVQAFCGPYRCFARPFWHYRYGAGF